MKAINKLLYLNILFMLGIVWYVDNNYHVWLMCGLMFIGILIRTAHPLKLIKNEMWAFGKLKDDPNPSLSTTAKLVWESLISLGSLMIMIVLGLIASRIAIEYFPQSVYVTPVLLSWAGLSLTYLIQFKMLVKQVNYLGDRAGELLDK